MLSITEHEFFTACDDDKAHLEAHQAKMWRGLTKGWQLFFAISYLITVVVCFICNVAVSKRLDWFWIVLSALMLGACFTNLPMLVKRERWAVCLGAATGCLLLLLLVCRLYTGVPEVMTGLGVTAVCLSLFWGVWAIRRFYGRHVAVLSLLWFSAWLFLLLTVIWLFVGGTWLGRLGYPIAAASLAVVWIYFAVGRWLPVNVWIKVGLYFVLTAFLAPVGSAFGEWLSGQPANPRPGVYFQWHRLLHPTEYEWIPILVFVCILLAAVILLAVGIIRTLCKKHPD